MTGKKSALVSNDRTVHRVYGAINKPLTIWGVERRLFFLAAVIGGTTFNFFGTLLGGLLMFVLLYLFARWATATDSQILRVLLNSGKFKVRYDPAKRTEFSIERIRSRDQVESHR
jgi:type IV secretory pathway TrbD component